MHLKRFTERLTWLNAFLTTAFIALLLLWSVIPQPLLLNAMLIPFVLCPIILMMMQGINKVSGFLRDFALFAVQSFITIQVETQLAATLKFNSLLFYWGGGCGIFAIGILGVISIYL